MVGVVSQIDLLPPEKSTPGWHDYLKYVMMCVTNW